MSAENILKKSVNHYLGTYIDRRQATVAEWVVLRPILEVCYKETGYEGGGEAPGSVVVANSYQEAAEC